MIGWAIKDEDGYVCEVFRVKPTEDLKRDWEKDLSCECSIEPAEIEYRTINGRRVLVPARRNE